MAITRMTNLAFPLSSRFPSAFVANVASVGPLPALDAVQLPPGALATETLSTVKPLGTETVTHLMPYPDVTVSETLVARRP